MAALAAGCGQFVHRDASLGKSELFNGCLPANSATASRQFSGQDVTPFCPQQGDLFFAAVSTDVQRAPVRDSISCCLTISGVAGGGANQTTALSSLAAEAAVGVRAFMGLVGVTVVGAVGIS